MKKILLLILILTTYPAFAACPVENMSGACIAEFKTMPLAAPMTPILPASPSVREFSPTPPRVGIKREIEPTRSLRMFGPTSSDYGYNSSCQFGICQNTGTPAE